MAIADIFEALSASDRPYKKAKPVSECLAIMGKLVLNNHLDGDIFTIFVRSGVYKEYINKFANPKQLDTFDIESIPGLTPLN
jgi:HD-GYP domain-containing protein (c-di-GMP phosphodiesterase class II)